MRAGSMFFHHNHAEWHREGPGAEEPRPTSEAGAPTRRRRLDGRTYSARTALFLRERVRTVRYRWVGGAQQGLRLGVEATQFLILRILPDHPLNGSLVPGAGQILLA